MPIGWLRAALDFAHDLRHFPRHRSAVGVAQHDRFRAAPHGRFQCLKRVGRIGFVAVEEMFGVIDHAAALRAQIGEALLDDAQVLFVGRAQHFGDVQRPRLADDGADRRAAHRAAP